MIESGSRDALFGAYAFAAALMCAAALVAAFIGVDAERKPLEEVCAPSAATEIGTGSDLLIPLDWVQAPISGRLESVSDYRSEVVLAHLDGRRSP